MAYGYNGKILHVDLTSRKITIEEPDYIFYRRYVGGGCLAGYYLLKKIKPGIDPLGPDNVLVFASSSISGSSIPGTSRYTVAAKSPLTGGFGEAEAGGFFGPELKHAGFDAICFYGKADHPVYLWIKDDQVEIRDARNIWGTTTGEAHERILADTGEAKAKVALIGPAGENLVKYACITNELRHFNGRCGLGAVMGSKNLKAIAVRGSGKIDVADADKVKELTKWFADNYRNNSGNASLYQMGSAGLVAPLNSIGLLPTRNFQTGQFEGASEIDGNSLTEKLTERESCYACPVRCKRAVQLQGKYATELRYGGPEYESIGALGSACGIRNLEAIIKGNELCNKYGLDTISTGMTIAFVMECLSKGLLETKDTGGLDLKFGNADAMLEAVEAIAFRKGFGNEMAEGTKRLAEKIGRNSESFAMQVKGQEVALHEPRGKWAVGLGYAVSPTGADHLESGHDGGFAQPGPGLDAIAPTGVIERMEPLSLGADKVRMFMYLQNHYCMYNTIGLCNYVAAPGWSFRMNQLVEIVRAVTGWETSLWELLKLGERANAMSRAFNVREGMGRAEDTLPQRFFEPIEGGVTGGLAISRQELEKALTIYYKMEGWDGENGVPQREKLAELDIEWVADELRV